MIITELYNGQGLGNQLWSYVVTRVLAFDRGVPFGIQSPEKFKGGEFLDLDFGQDVVGGEGPEGGPPVSLPEGIDHYYVEKDTWNPHFNCDIRGFDKEVRHIEDHTKIEGYFQSEELIGHRKKEIREWLSVKPRMNCTDYAAEDICVLNIRGGEYRGNSELILDKQYWLDAMEIMRDAHPEMKFVVVTDDYKYAKKLLPQCEVLNCGMAQDYSVILNAHYLILSNSSFAFFPAWLGENVKKVIAPKYWARHNVSDGFWACEFNLYREWQWLDRNGGLFTYDECKEEYERYKKEKDVQNYPSRPPIVVDPSLKARIMNKLSKMKKEIFNV